MYGFVVQAFVQCFVSRTNLKTNSLNLYDSCRPTAQAGAGEGADLEESQTWGFLKLVSSWQRPKALQVGTSVPATSDSDEKREGQAAAQGTNGGMKRRLHGRKDVFWSKGECWMR